MTNYIRRLTYYDLLFAGIGTVIGAGIFTLIGKACKYSGEYTWIATLIAGLFIYFITQSYIKINKKYDSNDAEYLVIKDVFGENISKIIILGAIIGGILTAYIVSEAFGEYLKSLFGVNENISTILCIVICTIINIIGIKELAYVNNVTTIMGIVGLIIITIMGIVNLPKIKSLHNEIIPKTQTLNNYNVIGGVLISAYIMLFSYFGFETLIKLNKESIDPQNDLPKAMNHTVISTTLLYTIIAYISVVYVGPTLLSRSGAPLATTIQKITPHNSIINYVKLCGVLLTFNTCLLTIAGTSRIIDDMMKPKNNDIIVKSKSTTPVKYIIFIAFVIMILKICNVDIITATFICNSGILTLLGGVFIASKMM